MRTRTRSTPAARSTSTTRPADPADPGGPAGPSTAPARPGRSAFGAALALAVGTGLALTAPLAASAHVELDATSTAPATISVLTFAVGHGCEGSSTTSLAVAFPADVQAVTPTRQPGWTIERTDTDTDPGTGTTNGTGTTITWTADEPLEDGLRDTVQASVLLPVDGAEGDVVAFPTRQECVTGSYDWDDLTTDGTEPAEPAEPAPSLVLGDAGTGAGAGTGTDVAGGAGGAATATGAGVTPPVDGTARLLGLGALVVGVVAVVTTTTALRRQQGGRR